MLFKFRKQIEEVPKYDYQFQLDNLSKQDIINMYADQLNITHKLILKNKDLQEKYNLLKKEYNENLEVTVYSLSKIHEQQENEIKTLRQQLSKVKNKTITKIIKIVMRNK